MVYVKRKLIDASFLISLTCIFVGAFYRLLFCLVFSAQPRDAYDYEIFIRVWEESSNIPFNASFPPLGLFLLKIPYHFFAYDIIKGAIIINMILGLLIIILLIQIIKETLNNLYALIFVGMISASSPALIRYSCQFLRENLYLFFSCIVVLFFIRFFKTKRSLEVIYLSLGTVCSALCRREGIELFVFYFFLLLYFLLRKEIAFKKTIFLSFLYIVSVSAFFIAISIICDVPFNYYMILISV